MDGGQAPLRVECAEEIEDGRAALAVATLIVVGVRNGAGGKPHTSRGQPRRHLRPVDRTDASGAGEIYSSSRARTNCRSCPRKASSARSEGDLDAGHKTPSSTGVLVGDPVTLRCCRRRSSAVPDGDARRVADLSGQGIVQALARSLHGEELDDVDRVGHVNAMCSRGEGHSNRAPRRWRLRIPRTVRTRNRIPSLRVSERRSASSGGHTVSPGKKRLVRIAIDAGTPAAQRACAVDGRRRWREPRSSHSTSAAGGSSTTRQRSGGR